MRTIAIINRKGGCGKTTTAVSLAAALGEAGRRTLLIDLDPQGSASAWLGGGPTENREVFDAFLGTQQLADLAVPTRAPGVELVPASSWLVTAERSLQVDLALGAIRALERLPSEWDYVLVDCPPTLGYLETPFGGHEPGRCRDELHARVPSSAPPGQRAAGSPGTRRRPRGSPWVRLPATRRQSPAGRGR